jgi:penicillin-binding protein 1A
MFRSSRWIRTFGLAALFVAAALAGTASGVLFAFAGDLPQISRLDDYLPSTITRVHARDGSIAGEFATERRLVVTYDQISPHLLSAVLAAEDSDFFGHVGLKVSRMFLALVRDVMSSRVTPGRSTITQQLARNVFQDTIGFDRAPNAFIDTSGWERKIKETLVALQIEKRYTKEEIFTMYCNQITWGHGAYGVQAASRLYFDKPASELNLDEAAMLAGIIQAPARQSPFVNLEAATRRRNWTLGRMADEGFITGEEATAAVERPIATRGEPTRPRSIAPYFMELVRQKLEEEYGSKAVYESGLVVRTGLDPALQQAANSALDTRLRAIDKLRGYRPPARNIVAEGHALDRYRLAGWSGEPTAGTVVPAVVMNVTADTVQVRVTDWLGTIGPAGYKWTARPAARVAKPGDVVEVRITGLDAERSTFTGNLEQAPEVQGAVLAIENRTGQILALVGGESFERSKFNRATQALRQVGSLFKPFVYMAAIDEGYTTLFRIDDSPVSFDVGPDQPPYEPRNYDREHHGEITLRQALEGSRNIPAVKLMAMLGPDKVIPFARRLGITAPIPPYLSVAIGSAEASLQEMVSAYSALPNQGVRMTPLTILEVADRDGNILEQHRAQPHEAIRADTAYIMTNLLEGVIQHGTARSALSLNWPVGGKTGTTNDYSDAWFIGFDPDITIGVWIGFDQKRPIGPNYTGTVAALPVWQEIMSSWVARRRAETTERPGFTRPGNVVIVQTEYGPEAFIAGTEPSGRPPVEGRTPGDGRGGGR